MFDSLFKRDVAVQGNSSECGSAFVHFGLSSVIGRDRRIAHRLFSTLNPSYFVVLWQHVRKGECVRSVCA